MQCNSLNTEPPGDEDTVDDAETIFRIPDLNAGNQCVRRDRSSVLDIGGSVVANVWRPGVATMVTGGGRSYV